MIRHLNDLLIGGELEQRERTECFIVRDDHLFSNAGDDGGLKEEALEMARDFPAEDDLCALINPSVTCSMTFSRRRH
jgi:hypothetical protein